MWYPYHSIVEVKNIKGKKLSSGSNKQVMDKKQGTPQVGRNKSSMFRYGPHLSQGQVSGNSLTVHQLLLDILVGILVGIKA